MFTAKIQYSTKRNRQLKYALEIRGLNKSYDNINAIKDLSFTVPKGSVFGFLGPNGAGKTTTMKIILGLAYPTSGTVEVFGQHAGSLTAASTIGYLPENPTLYRYLSAFEYIVMHGRLTGLTNLQANHEANRLLDQVGLGDDKHRRIRQYSKGMMQRVGLACALVHEPQLLLLDEPFDGLDVLGRVEMKKLLLDLKKQHKTIFFNSHILSDVAELCDSVGIIDRGTLIEAGVLAHIVPKNQSLEQYFVNRIERTRDADTMQKQSKSTSKV